MTAVTSRPPAGIQAAIPNSGSISIGIHVAGKLSAIQIPPAWTAAAITFQASQDGLTYYDVYDGANATTTERTIASANIPTTGGRFLPLDLVDWIGVNYVKIRSGTSAAPVNQGAERVIILVMAG